MNNRELHKDKAPAVEYADGLKVWVLHGVTCPQWMVAADTDGLVDLTQYDQLNADQKREFIRKFGIDRIYHKLGGQTIAQSGNYTLINLNYGTGGSRKYLKMLNPSIRTWHMEPVSPECETIQHCLNYRRYGKLEKGQLKWQPKKLT